MWKISCNREALSELTFQTGIVVLEGNTNNAVYKIIEK